MWLWWIETALIYERVRRTLAGRRQREQIRWSSFVLRGWRGARRRIVEEKLFVKRGEKWLNVTSRQQRRMKEENRGMWARHEMRNLTDLAGGLVLCMGVKVGGRLRNKHDKEQRRAKSKQPR